MVMMVFDARTRIGLRHGDCCKPYRTGLPTGFSAPAMTNQKGAPLGMKDDFACSLRKRWLRKR
jgi:hypothetical protein